MHTVGNSLHQGLRTRRVRGGDGRFKPREGPGGRGALARKIRRRSRWRRRGRGRVTLRVVLGESGRAGRSLRRGQGLRRSGEQRPLAAVGRALRLGGVQEGGSGVVDRRGGQRRRVELGGSQGGRLRLARRLAVGLLLLRRATGRRSHGTGRAGLRRRDGERVTQEVGEKKKKLAEKGHAASTYRVGRRLLKTRRGAVPQRGRVSTFGLTI